VRSVEDDEFTTNPMLWGFAEQQAHKYSADLSMWVRSGKDRQWERGEWVGGPIPDGYQRDGKTLAIDVKREPVIPLLWELALDGRAPAPLARELNAAGLRTKATKKRPAGAWTRRRVHDALSNAVYAGMLVRHRGSEREQRQPGGFPAYVTLEQFEAVAHHARQRDVAAAGRAKTGRPSRRFLLATLARCSRCGGGVYSVTSTHGRKDGTRRRLYMCGEVKEATGMCDAPTMPAELVDGYVCRRPSRTRSPTPSLTRCSTTR
jgi:hypothetical protein